MNGFPQKSVEQLLVACHRRCCICHRWCGTKMEIDHIVERTDGGSNEMENAIALCFDCHAEAHAYNPRHPRGRRFMAAELRAHREQWLQLCKEHPETLIGPWRDADVGPLQAMIDELEFDAALAERIAHGHELLPMLHVDQFKRAIAAGAISGLRDEIKAVCSTPTALSSAPTLRCVGSKARWPDPRGGAYRARHERTPRRRMPKPERARRRPWKSC